MSPLSPHHTPWGEGGGEGGGESQRGGVRGGEEGTARESRRAEWGGGRSRSRVRINEGKREEHFNKPIDQ